MKISYNWLKRYINPIPSPQECSALLTDTGLEVESFEAIETVKGGLKGLVVGEVMSCTQHPNADRLRLTTVNIGQENHLSIVCGAPNVAVGQKVIVATIGTELFPSEGDSFKIKESKIRGELSQGMLCAEDEIGLGKSHDGILVLPADTRVGLPAADYFGLESDYTFEIGLTPNRTDAMSHLGVARDLRAALYKNPNYTCSLPDINTELSQNQPCAVEVRIENQEALSRYSGICLQGVHIEESPAWLKNSLLAIGLRPINNVVDVTNFVMHELGQPLHAFDLSKIKNSKIRVGVCAPETSFITLDGQTRKLTGTELMICDSEGPMCMAGIFGGADSGVSESTTSIFLESACFDAVWVRKASKLHGLKTDSSFRFERGANPEITVTALERAVDLLHELTGATVLGGLFDAYETPQEWAAVNLRWKKLTALVGEEIPKEDVIAILNHLGIRLEAESSLGLKLSIPPFKNDVKGEADVVEEILRIYGYNTIAIPAQVRSSVNITEGTDLWKFRNRISDLLSAQGFNEILNNSLTAGSNSKLLPENTLEAVKLLNPLSSELDTMRSSMLFGMCETLRHNINRQQGDLALYEWGKVYGRKDQKFIEQEKLSLAICGNLIPQNWHNRKLESGFFTLKGVIELIARFLGIPSSDLKIKELNHPGFSISFELYAKKVFLGILGDLSNATRKSFDLPANCWFCELDLAGLLSAYENRTQSYMEAPKFPAVRRDLALVIDSDTLYEGIARVARETERKILKDVVLFDVYAGDKLPAGKKSYAVSFVLQDEEQTLNDKQVEKTMDRLMKAFSDQLGAELRN